MSWRRITGESFRADDARPSTRHAARGIGNPGATPMVVTTPHSSPRESRYRIHTSSLRRSARHVRNPGAVPFIVIPAQAG
ncbi:MAG: hypothetical protein M3N38_11490, partial [Pseudomonadota bacterium]|nr:hypothetical protein [Pseudomonadota bacterium]